MPGPGSNPFPCHDSASPAFQQKMHNFCFTASETPRLRNKITDEALVIVKIPNLGLGQLPGPTLVVNDGAFTKFQASSMRSFLFAVGIIF